MISAAAAVNPGFFRHAGESGPVDSLFDRLTKGRAPEQPVAAEPDLRERGYAVLRRSLQEQLSLPAARPQHTLALSGAETDGPRAIADTVLGFVAARLQRESESGASPERLRDLLGQARSGFEAGLSQASDELDALGLLSEQTQAGIDEVKNLVDAGLDRLEGRFVDGSSAHSGPAVSSLFEASRSVRVAGSESLSLEVHTRDGDTIRLSFRESSGYAQSSFVSAAEGPSGRTATAGFQQSAFYSSRYSVSVDGQLDESEQRALQDLLGRVERLADDFFEGDSQAALKQALDLGYDRDEIAGFSLRLTETSVRQITESYRAVQSYAAPAEQSQGPVEGLRNLGQFLKAMREAVESARAFSDGEDLIADLFRVARQLDPRDVAAGDDATLQARQTLLDLLSARHERDFSDIPVAEDESTESESLPAAA